MADRIGVRRVVLVGAVSVSLSALAASLAPSLTFLYVVYFLGGLLGAGALIAPLMALISKWFVAGAGLAIGLASAGQALGQGGVPFGTSFLIEALGWRGALVAQGIISLAILVPLAFLIREPDYGGAGQTDTASAPEDLPLPLGVVVPWLSLAVILCCTCMAVPLMHLVPLIQDSGMSAPEASSVLFTMLVVAIYGRALFGRLADLIGPIPAYFTASAWQTFFVFFFTWIDDLNGFYIYAAVYGFGYAGVMTGILTTTQSLTPAASRGLSMGIVLAFAYLGHGIGGWQSGYFFDQTGGYGVSYLNAALAGGLNLIVVAALYLTIQRRRPGLPSPA